MTHGRKNLFLYMIIIIFCRGHSFSSEITFTQKPGIKIRQVRRKYVCMKSPPNMGRFTGRSRFLNTCQYLNFAQYVLQLLFAPLHAAFLAKVHGHCTAKTLKMLGAISMATDCGEVIHLRY